MSFNDMATYLHIYAMYIIIFDWACKYLFEGKLCEHKELGIRRWPEIFCVYLCQRSNCEI